MMDLSNLLPLLDRERISLFRQITAETYEETKKQPEKLVMLICMASSLASINMDS